MRISELLNRIKEHPFFCKRTSDSYIRYLKRHGCKIGEGVRFYAPKSTTVDPVRLEWISIGSYTKISFGVTILAHDYSPSVLIGTHKKCLLPGGAETVIGNNCFIGANATILSGRKIGNHCIIGAGAVVTKDVPDYSVCAGNPAQIVMTTNEYYQKCDKKYLSAAVRNVNHFAEVHGRLPETKELYGFAMLYLERSEDNWNKYYSNYLVSDNNSEDVKQTFFTTEPIFSSYEEFVSYCMEQK